MSIPRKIIEKVVQNGDTHYGYYVDNNTFIIHNDNGPAIIYADGGKEWWVHDRLHREDGPAIIYTDGAIEWWVNNKEITIEVEEWLKERNLDSDNLSEEDQFALLLYLKIFI